MADYKTVAAVAQDTIYEKKSDTKTFECDGFEIVDSRKYGIAVFDFYKEQL